MPSTMAEALAEVQGPKFDRIVGYVTVRPTPKKAAKDVEQAFRRVRKDFFNEVARSLAASLNCQEADAEDAVSGVIVDIFERREDLTRQSPESWRGYLYRCAKFRLLDIRSHSRDTASIEELVEDRGDSALSQAKRCVPDSNHHEETESTRVSRKPGESWTRELVIGAIQRFFEVHGRPPKSVEFRAVHLLPSHGVLYRHFDTLADSLIAAGVAPTSSRRRKPWSAAEAAKSCRSFRYRNGYWPNWSEARRHPGELPGPAAMIRFFGGTGSIEVQEGSEAILAGT